MIAKEYKFWKKTEEKSYYCKVSLEVEIKDTSLLSIVYDDLYVEEEWKTSIEFGIKYFHEHYNKGITVIVKKMHTMIVDTSQIVVVCAVVNCLAEMLNENKDLMTLDERNNLFQLGK